MKGHKPTIIRLDNEISKECFLLLEILGLKGQLVRPHEHRQNLAKWAISTYKNHFIAGLSGEDPNFPLILWHTLIPEVNTTINLLRNSHTNPKLSSYAPIFGQFDYNANVLAPPGCKCIVHGKPTMHRTLSVHGIKAYYAAPTMKNYRRCKVHIQKTLAKRIADTITFLPHNIKMPIRI